MVPIPFRVTKRRRELADTWTLELEPVGGERVLPAPGQFTMLYAFGIGEVPISVSSAPGVAGPVMLTVRSVGAVSGAICSSEPGAVLGLRFGGSAFTSIPTTDR
jgi:NAD(P)H-flavin reductase